MTDESADPVELAIFSFFTAISIDEFGPVYNTYHVRARSYMTSVPLLVTVQWTFNENNMRARKRL